MFTLRLDLHHLAITGIVWLWAMGGGGACGLICNYMPPIIEQLSAVLADHS